MTEQPTDRMVAVTIHEPWATLIAIGEKRIETRSWAPKYRGPIAIHAAARIPAYAYLAFGQSPEFARVFEEHGIDTDLEQLPTGCVIATANLVNCRIILRGADRMDMYRAGLTCREEAFGNFEPGRYTWMLDDVRRLKIPIPASGRQSLWPWFLPEEGLEYR